MAFGNDPTTGTFSPTQGNEDVILKDLFSPDGVTDQFFYNNPFLAMIEKDENAGGRTYDQPVWGRLRAGTRLTIRHKCFWYNFWWRFTWFAGCCWSIWRTAIRLSCS